MGGLFGGLLGLVHAVGYGLLYVLIGSAAERDTGEARWTKVILGSVSVGLVFGLIGFWRLLFLLSV
jgi:hypothetical protein